MARRAKNAIVWRDLGEIVGDEEYQGIEVGIRHLGPRAARTHLKRIERLRMNELKRVVKLREELTPDVAPQLFEDPGEMAVHTIEGVEELEAISRQFVDECLAGVRGWPEVDGLDHAGQVDELDRLDLCGLLGRAMMEVQSPRDSFRSAAESPRDTQPKGRAGDGV